MRTDNHYVSRNYLKRWATDGLRLQVYRVLVPHTGVPLWRSASTRGVAYHEHLYTKVASAGESDEIERWLDAEFEAPAEEAIAKVVAGKRLSPHDWRVLARFFAAQDVRTPARLLENMKKWSETMPTFIQESMTESIAEIEALDPPKRALLATTVKKTDDVPFKVTIERREGEAGGWVKGETVSGRSLWLWSIRSVLTGNAIEGLCKNRWTILAPPDGLSWFTSDDPAIKVNFNSLEDYNFGGGWGWTGSELLLPLSPQHLLYSQVGKPVPPRGSKLNPTKAAIVRRLIAEHAHRYVFADQPDPSVPALRPRTVDAAELKREQGEWARWHAEQTAAHRRLMGW